MTWNDLPSSMGDDPLLTATTVPTRRSSNASTPSPTMAATMLPSSPTLSSSDAPSPTSAQSPPSSSSSSSPHSLPSSQRNSNRLFAVFFLILCTASIGMLNISTQLRRESPLLHTMSPLTVEETNSQTLRRQQETTPSPPPPPSSAPPPRRFTTKLPVEERWRRLGDLNDYECVGWRATADCSPNGPLLSSQNKSCDAVIENGESGYCELRHKSSASSQRVLEMFCDSLRPGVTFKCQDYIDLLQYGKNALHYVHDKSFSFQQCRLQLQFDQVKVGNTANALLAVNQGGIVPSSRPLRSALSSADAFYQRGIAIVVFDRVLESVYASVRSLRDMGCTLPIELWYIPSETSPSHPLLRALLSHHGVFLREILDPHITKFYTKLYAVFYSAFDQVLLLDADNFAVRDPTFLFATNEFVGSGALFWPDFWRFRKTIFNIQPTSFVWDVLDLDPIDMFEQESGQVLIDRKRHVKAMNVMMYYALHPTILENMRLVWGDKDLFRFAWLKTNSEFHMIQMPPGAAGTKLAEKNVFCGVTMVQHDPNHKVLFLHRNQEKLSRDNKRLVWQHIQQFNIGAASLDDYDVRGANGGRYFPGHKRCFGKDIYYEKAFVVTPVANLPFARLESRLLQLVDEANDVMDKAGYK